jgi:hypothetical protein
MSQTSEGVKTISLTVRVQLDEHFPEFPEALCALGPGATPRDVVASEILSNLGSVGYVRWARIHGVRNDENPAT